MGQEYEHAVHISGSGDGYFCHKCDNTPPEKVKELHHAYKKIQALRDIETNWHKNFKVRTDVAEEILRGYWKRNEEEMVEEDE